MSDSNKFPPKKNQVLHGQNGPSDPKPKKLLEQVQEALRTKHYSYRTEQTYIDWIKRYILFHKKQHPKDLSVEDIRAFISHLATERKVATSTQNQALSAILFLYRNVLHKELDEQALGFTRPKKGKRIPVVLTPAEARTIISHLTGPYKLMVQIMYGSGLRLMECLRLRIKDFDFGNQSLIVYDGKGGDDRITMLPQSIIAPLQKHLQEVKTLHQKDLNAGFGSVYLPYALEKKYPAAHKQWIWQYAFPASVLSAPPQHSPLPLGEGSGVRDGSEGKLMRHHIHETALQKAIRQATALAKVNKRVTPPHLPPLLRHPPPPKRLRHPHRPGTPRTQRRQNHHDLHPRITARSIRRQIPA